MEDYSWIFESLVNLLHGPIWKMPILSFIEEKSVVFDPDSYSDMTDEREDEFRKIHDDYKGLVDYMLTNFMEDIQVTPEQVELACKAREESPPSQGESVVTKAALEELWAAEDFQTFRRLMTRKNVELQLQSLELLLSRYGSVGPSLRASEKDDMVSGEEDFLQVVMNQMIDPDYNQKEGRVVEQPVVKMTTKSATEDDEDSLTQVEILSVAPQQHQILTSMKKNLEMTDEEVVDLPDSQQNDNLQEGGNISNPPLATSNPNEASMDIGYSPEELEKRREYLKDQRDKLLAVKKKKREEQLNSTKQGLNRPKSAKAAQMALTDNVSTLSGSRERSLTARRALAERLKQELVIKKD